MDKFSIGLDIGSTTIKIVVLDDKNQVVFSSYDRHHSDIKEMLSKVLVKVISKYDSFKIMVTGSGGISVSNWLGIPFIQEVVAGANAIRELLPTTDVAIELGGEDAKITYFTNGLDQRMNGSCAGGTGAFIDQMATLLGTDAMGLNELAKNAQITYPIASRCGVFAKSDIQPLINDGAKKEDIAGSIFQSVVNQTISGLACGKPIRGNVAFLGGPLFFLSELRQRFIDTLHPQSVLAPSNAQVFNAIGAALSATKEIDSKTLLDRLKRLDKIHSVEVDRLEPLFNNEQELDEFRVRHSKTKIPFSDIKSYTGPCFLGIDAGSTTTKLALIDDEGGLLYSYYGSNSGDPLASVINILKEMYKLIPSGAFIARSTVTGYGEALLKTALKLDCGEIETMAHQTASNFILPGVQFILDIGGQDMKCMRIKDGVISDILLNEACSSGCGSFIETFAKALGLGVEEFAKKGLESTHPVDLGSRCTVFMNSRVKQAQKEGASVSDISAGLAYSVVKNALFKVIKLRDFSEMGDKIIVQGGTFMNESVLRAFEKTCNREVIRPDKAGLMGAYGSALISKKEYTGGKSSILTPKELEEFTIQKTTKRCPKCGNHCLLTISTFNDGKQFITNNRCSRGGNQEEQHSDLPNLYEQKYKRLFAYYKPLESKLATRGMVGIPRTLNMYEHYPFWFTFFTNLKYRVILSPRSTREIFNEGIDTMPSESCCYPAKLTHGHVTHLVKKGIKFIFYPCIPFEIEEDKNADNHYNCPIVSAYPEVLKNNMTEVFGDDVNFCAPFLPINTPSKMKKRLAEEFPDIPKSELNKAVDLAYIELENYKNDVHKMGEDALNYISTHHIHGIVLAGRPYHIDPEINHGIPELINSYGFAVLSEDSISHLDKVPRPIRVVDQWTYHSRLYSAANYVRKRDDLDIVQLNSFGCGLDAVTTDQVNELMAQYNKIYTVLKIDEVNNLGAAKIRLRSLIAVINEKRSKHIGSKMLYEMDTKRRIFTKEMKENYKIIAPEISPIHLSLIKSLMQGYGYDLEVLPPSPTAVETGLKYVNNDACYPTIITIGQILDAILSGKYDTNRLAIILTQTGGVCRATNYIALLRKALRELNLQHIPVLSLNFVGMEKNPGFKINVPLMRKLAIGAMYGDLLMRCLYRTRPYEKLKGSAQAVYKKWDEKLCHELKNGNTDDFGYNVRAIVRDFSAIQLLDIKKPRVGIVGEILVKFHPQANNHLVELIESEGGEAVVPDLLDFLMYAFYNDNIKYRLLDGKLSKKMMSDFLIWYLEQLRKPMVKALSDSKFGAPIPIQELAKKAEQVVSLGNISGEGWLLTSEMIELIESGAGNIVCVQPFACLPNHVTGKGVMKAIKSNYPQANIVAVDYDPGASEVNQVNRIKLMMSTALNNIKKQQN